MRRVAANDLPVVPGSLDEVEEGERTGAKPARMLSTGGLRVVRDDTIGDVWLADLEAAR